MVVFFCGVHKSSIKIYMHTFWHFKVSSSSLIGLLISHGVHSNMRPFNIEMHEDPLAESMTN